MCVLVYARAYTQNTWVLDVSPGVGRTPEEPEESRLTTAQYTCRPYRCTQYIVYIYAGLRALMIWANCLFSLNMSFLFRKVEDVTTISKSQSLTSVSIKDCTLRVPNETTTLFLLRVIIKVIFIQLPHLTPLTSMCPTCRCEGSPGHHAYAASKLATA